MEKIDLKSLKADNLSEILTKHQFKKYKAIQIFRWIHQKNIEDIDLMSDINKNERELLKKYFYINKIEIKDKLKSNIDKTVKYLYNLEDGEMIETVVMDYSGKKSICVSTQVGCKMGCDFCASSTLGFVRNLLPSEMLNQVYMAQKDLNQKISNVVLMGIGEPLENYDNVMDFIRILNDKNGQNISLRKITLSSCGICDKIERMILENLPITLSISLHAPNDSIRNKLMPISKKYNIENLLKVCKEYGKKTKRRVTFEYICLKGLNDSEQDAKELADKLNGILCHVNLISYNQVDKKDYKSSKSNIIKFKKVLEKNNITTTIRRSLGKDLNAACGQLRKNRMESQ